jgi:hypothetical protein
VVLGILFAESEVGHDLVVLAQPVGEHVGAAGKFGVNFGSDTGFAFSLEAGFAFPVCVPGEPGRIDVAAGLIVGSIGADRLTGDGLLWLWEVFFSSVRDLGRLLEGGLLGWLDVGGAIMLVFLRMEESFWVQDGVEKAVRGCRGGGWCRGLEMRTILILVGRVRPCNIWRFIRKSGRGDIGLLRFGERLYRTKHPV